MIAADKRSVFGYFFAALVTIAVPAGLYWLMRSPAREIQEEEELFLVEGNTVRTLYGTFTNVEPVIIDLIKCKAFQRLKHVAQYGIMRYFRIKPTYTRYAHCIGTWAVLRLYGATLNEQIAGLLHDVSHTVFSHLGDYIFYSSENSSYQDDIFEQFLKKYGIEEVLARYNISVSDINPKTGDFKLLEQPRPDLNADRVEYNLRGALIDGLATKQEIDSMRQALHFEDGRWFFTDKAAAIKFSDIPLYLSEHEWLAPYTCFVSIWMAAAVRRALAIGLISEEDIHFSTDDVVWDHLMQAEDSEIKELVKRAKEYTDGYSLVDNKDEADKWVKTKFMGVDPWVRLDDGRFERLTQLDQDYRIRHDALKERMSRGWFMKIRGGCSEALHDIHAVSV